MAEHTNDVDWSGLFHASGSALDTPRHLKALLGDDAEAFVDGYSQLWSTLRRDGKAWPATAPTALLVCDLLDDPLLGPDDPSLRDAMLSYLHWVGVAADLGDRAAGIRALVQEHSSDLRSWTADYLSADTDGRARMWEDDIGLGDLVLDQATLACFDVVPEILGRVVPYLGSERSRRRACAAGAVGALARHPSAAEQRPMLVRRLVGMTHAAEDSYELATIVTAIGQLDGDTRPWLGDPNPGVRVCAALAPALAEDEAATRVLLEAAASPRAFSASFGDMAPPQHFQAARYRDPLMQALLERVDDPAKLAPALIATLPLGHKTASRTRARLLLQALFPAWPPESDLSPLQRSLAGLVAACDRLWELDDAARAELFHTAGLPQERQAWAAMAQPGPADPDHHRSTYAAENIVVFEGLTAIRSRPDMFFGTGRTHPELPDRVVAMLRSEYGEAVATGYVGSFSIEVESERRFTVEVHGHRLPSLAGEPTPDLDRVFSKTYPPRPTQYLSFASALSSRIWVRAWTDGQQVTAEYVDGLAIAPAHTLGTTDQLGDGYHVTFEMDDEWRPLGSIGDF